MTDPTEVRSLILTYLDGQPPQLTIVRQTGECLLFKLRPEHVANLSEDAAIYVNRFVQKIQGVKA
jgi:hypothetical protein